MIRTSIFMRATTLIVATMTTVTVFVFSNAGAESLQMKSMSCKLDTWPGGNGRVITDDGIVIGLVDEQGNVSVTAAGAPKGGIYPISTGYKCDGTNLSNPSANYQNLGNKFAVIDDGSTPIGRVIVASSFDVASWDVNPVSNAAVPGYTISLVYVDQATQSTGFCQNASDMQDRRLDFKPGWNIQKTEITAVGDSPFFEPDQPTRTILETIDAMPSDAKWIYESFSPAQQESMSKNPNLPSPVQEVIDEATDVATEAAKDEVNDSVRRGIGRLFGK
jgi:hypothetical protein